MSVDLTQPQGIAEEVLFGGIDAGTIHRKPQPVSTSFDTTTGNYVKPAPTLIYSGKLTVSDQTSNNQGGQQLYGAVEATRQRWLVKIPLGSPPIEGGDVVTVTAARDSELVGHRFVVRDIGGGTFKVVRRLSCERWEPGSTQDWMMP